MTLDAQAVTAFQTKILAWYRENQRDLPWRKTSNPYAILISEVMSQQTQISRVVPKYLSWMKTFPTIESLANASTATVLKQWSGLGYNRRALNVQKAAKEVAKTYHSKWPKEVSELEKLPGIGKYTASALACFAFNAQVPVIDTNIRKVIAVTFNDGVVPSEKELESLAWQLLPMGSAKDWNQALMDYAGAVLKKEKIPVPKQSKFLGSNRWYRGNLLKLLTTEGMTTTSYLVALWSKEKDKEWVETLLSTLEKEGFIRRNGEQITLS